jgi:hypothetical protein
MPFFISLFLRSFHFGSTLILNYLLQVAERVGVFAKLPTNAKSWMRRLQLLDGLDHALHVCGSRTTQKDAFKIIMLIAEDGTKPAPWWSRNADVALMLGVYRHGYANYDAVRLDPEVGQMGFAYREKSSCQSQA